MRLYQIPAKILQQKLFAQRKAKKFAGKLQVEFEQL